MSRVIDIGEDHTLLGVVGPDIAEREHFDRSTTTKDFPDVRPFCPTLVEDVSVQSKLKQKHILPLLQPLVSNRIMQSLIIAPLANIKPNIFI